MNELKKLHDELDKLLVSTVVREGFESSFKTILLLTVTKELSKFIYNKKNEIIDLLILRGVNWQDFLPDELLATQVYYRQNNCSLTEARNVVKQFVHEIKCSDVC